MANSILGNNGLAMYWTTQYEVEDDEGETYETEGEMIDEMDVFGYRAITPKASQTTSVKIFFYYRRPTSDWYWNQAYGMDFYPMIPLVFSCDANWKLTQLLNANTYQVSFEGRSNGWIEMNVTLHRKLVKGERIFFGVYSEILGPVGTHENDPTGMCYLYFSSERRNNYANDIAYVTSSNWLNKANSFDWYNDMCCYLQYENEIESVAYTRTVLGNVAAATSNTRKSVWKRTLTLDGNITSALSRKADWKRNNSSNGSYVSSLISHNRLTRGSVSGFAVTDDTSKKLFFFRSLENTSLLNARNNRALGMKIEKSDGFNFTDSLQHLLLIFRSVFSSGGLSENLTNKTDYKRMPESLVDDEETVTRWGESFRGFSDEIEIQALSFASRIFFRTVQTVMSFWDWLRGKIREANNVVTFFCPVDLEINFRCKI